MWGRATAGALAAWSFAGALACTQRNPVYGLGLPPLHDAAASEAAAGEGDAAPIEPTVDGAGSDRPDGSVNQPSSSRVVGYWRFDETSGTTAADASRYAHHGHLEGLGAGAWTAGYRGGALNFHAGKLGQGVQVPITPTLDGLRAFTIAAWCLPRRTGPGPLWAIVSRQRSNDGDELFDLTVSDDELIVFMPKNIDGLSGQARVRDIVETDRWNHVAATYDGRTLRLFANGVEVAATPNLVDRLHSSTTPLYIGTNKNSMLNSDLDDEPFEGLLDEVVLYSVALGAADIKAIKDGASVFAY
jgi:hypothetical protein